MSPQSSTAPPPRPLPPQQHQQTVTLIGLGAMGTALAHALLNPPRSASPSTPPPTIALTIHNRTPTRPSIPALLARGATFQHSLPLALAASSTIVICLLSYAAVDEVLRTLGAGDAARAVLEAKVVVNLTNGTPGQARGLAAWMRREAGVRAYVDGAVMATPGMVGGEGGRVFLAADGGAGSDDAGAGEGEREGWREEVSRVVGQFGELVWFAGGDPGAAAVQDLACLAAMYGLFGGVITALGLVKRCGAVGGAGGAKDKEAALAPGLPSAQMFIRPLLEGILPLVDHIASEWDEGVEEGGPHPLLMQQIGLQNILQACEEAGVDGGSLRHLTGKFEEAVNEGGAEGSLTLVARKFMV